MIEINQANFKLKPFAHQLEGIKALVKYPSFAIFDEPGAGKSKQVVSAACILAENGKVDTVIIVAPASVRTVWCDPEIGEIKKHAWIPVYVSEYANGKTTLRWESAKTLEDISAPHFIVTNYEILRGAKHLEYFLNEIKHRKVLLVLDESSYIKSRTAEQTKAVAKLRQACTRCVILNGTPVVNNPLDLWSQFNILDKNILGRSYSNYWHFRANYAVMGGWKNKQVVKWVNLDKLTKILAPHVLRREKKDCLDLPPKLYTIREVALTHDSWRRYQELKKDAVMALGNGDQLLEPNAAVRVMRLAQITSGHIGRLIMSENAINEPVSGNREIPRAIGTESGIEDLSSEKLDWLVKYLTEESSAQYIITWCRWRRERERLYEMLKKVNCHCFQLYGGQKQNERDCAVAAFSEARPIDAGKLCIMLAQPHAGGHGLNLIMASESIYLSNDFSLGIRLQSEDRCHRMNTKHAVTYIDVLCTGPKGQKTIDHTIHRALQNKQNLAALTTAAWRKELA